MRHDALLQLLFAQSTQGVERAPHLEGADPLEVLAFEEEIDLRPGWPLALPWRPDEIGWRLGSGCQGVERPVRQYWRFVDVRLDDFVGRLYGGTGEGQGIAHGGGIFERSLRMKKKGFSMTEMAFTIVLYLEIP